MPLIIDAVPCGNALIGLCAEPRPDQIGDVVHWQPDLVLSLVEEATALKMAFATVGIAWLHLPIADYGVPDIGGTARWRSEIAPALHRILDDDRRLLIHCRAGCGRTGMAVLRLLVERGEGVSEALPRLRRIRPCAVETSAQLDWAARG